jgi:hypothetical protein
MTELYQMTPKEQSEYVQDYALTWIGDDLWRSTSENVSGSLV